MVGPHVKVQQTKAHDPPLIQLETSSIQLEDRLKIIKKKVSS